MAELLTVSGQCLADLQSGLVAVCGAASEEFARLTLEHGVSAGIAVYDRPCWTFSVAWMYLEACWRDRCLMEEVEIDLARDPRVILDALRTQRLVLVDQLAETGRRVPGEGLDVVEARIVALERFTERVILDRR